MRPNSENRTSEEQQQKKRSQRLAALQVPALAKRKFFWRISPKVVAATMPPQRNRATSLWRRTCGARTEPQLHLLQLAQLALVLGMALLLGSVTRGGGVTAVRIERSAYQDINVAIDEDLPRQLCRTILTSLERSMSEASEALYIALDGRFHFGAVNIFLPPSWTDNECIPSPSPQERGSAARFSTPSTGGRSDLTVTATHAVLGDAIWTQQYGGCGTPAAQIYAAHKGLTDGAAAGKRLLKEWAKYRYGVFDEIGYHDDPIYTPCYHAEGVAHITGCTDHEPDSVVATGYENCEAPSDPYADFARLVGETARTSLMFAPQAEGVRHFCDAATHNRYAPTKHNYMCDRRPTLDVIQQHADFAAIERHPTTEKTVDGGSDVVDTRPLFQYKRRLTTRYVVVIDDSLDIAQRESWSFLRSAFRKWVVYDLLSHTEVGVVLANGRTVEKSLDLTPLANATNRDLVASFLPYTPSDSRQATCIGCALDKAIGILENRTRAVGPASSVVLIIAPGMEHATNVLEIADRVQMRSRARIAAINYPDLLGRLPLDALARASDGVAFSVHEHKFNGEKSYLTTYVQLSNALMDVARHFHEAASPAGEPSMLPLEVHRNVIYDTGSSSSRASGNETTSAMTAQKRSTRQASGQFFLEEQLGLPAGFFIYTHSAETPLIQTMRLRAPSGRIYATRSDLRMPVKQLTLVAALNETGVWRYEIERYPGNPQPHVVQVLATPRSAAHHIGVRAWVERTGRGTDAVFTLYCEVRHGRYPVREALVRAQLQYDRDNSNSPERQTIALLDSGGGDADITAGDGIYSCHVAVRGPGTYSFDFYVSGVDGNAGGSPTYALRADVMLQEQLQLSCCGSEFASVASAEGSRRQQTVAAAQPDDWTEKPIPSYTVETGPFERYAPMLTFYVEAQEFSTHNNDNDSDKDSNKDGSDNAVTATNYGDAETPQSDSKRPIAQIRSRHGSFGHILSLSAQLVGERYTFRWTTPDVPHATVTNYELRCAPSIAELVDRFNSTELVALHAPLGVLAAGTPVRYVHELSRTPAMYGRLLFFAIRPQLARRTRPAPTPISNVVQLRIPARVVAPLSTPAAPAHHSPPTYARPRHPTALDAAGGGANATSADTGVTSVAGVSQLEVLRYAIPVGVMLLLLLFVGCIVCYMTRCRHQTPEDRNKINASVADSPPDLTPTHVPSGDDLLPHHLHPHLATLGDSPMMTVAGDANEIGGYARGYDSKDGVGCHPDHHTVGIPIYDDDLISKKRLSTSGSQGYTIDDLGHHIYHHQLGHYGGGGLRSTATGSNNNIGGGNGSVGGSFYNGNISIIATVQDTSCVQQQQPPQFGSTSVAGESWSATQLLGVGHQRCGASPLLDSFSGTDSLQRQNRSQQQQLLQQQLLAYDRMSLDDGCGRIGVGLEGVPPVPPLPLLQQNNVDYHAHHVYQQQPQQQQQQQRLHQGFQSGPFDYEYGHANGHALETVGVADSATMRDAIYVPHMPHNPSPLGDRGAHTPTSYLQATDAGVGVPLNCSAAAAADKRRRNVTMV